MSVQQRADRLRPKRRMPLLGAAALVVGLMSGCSPQVGDITAGTARTLQSSVVAIAEAAASDDIDGALAALNTLEAQLTAGLGNGTIDAERGAAIRAAIDTVRADLEAAGTVPSKTPAPSVPATTAPSDDSGSTGDGGEDDNGNTGDNGNENGNSGNGNSGNNGNNGNSGNKGEGNSGNGKGNEKTDGGSSTTEPGDGTADGGDTTTAPTDGTGDGGSSTPAPDKAGHGSGGTGS